MSESGPCDVLIAGAGPAGLLLAHLLAQGGASVVVVDPLQDLHQGAFSSAALPLEALKLFNLPDEVIGSHWHQWQLFGPEGQCLRWPAQKTLGVVLDFGKLRTWLSAQARSAGAQITLGCRALRWQPSGAGAAVLLQQRGASSHWQSCRWLVDATGQQRALIGAPSPKHGPLIAGAGVEWLLEVSTTSFRRWADQLSFMLGSTWVPQGYGWVFPMEENRLKLGVCRLHDPSREQPPLHALLRSLQQRLDLADARVLDRHGGLIRSTIRRREPHRIGPLIGLGDAVSTANLLGGEGIRHAMASSEVLAPLLLKALAGGSDALSAYAPRLRRRLGWRWSLSGRLARRTWFGLHGPGADRRLTRLLHGLEAQASANDLAALLFRYRFERYGLRVLPYLFGWA